MCFLNVYSPKVRFPVFSLFKSALMFKPLLIAAVCCLTISGIAQAQEYCDEEATTKRRRPGAEPCIERSNVIDLETRDNQEENRSAIKRTDARRPGDEQREVTNQAKQRKVLPQKAASLPKPLLQDYQTSIPVPDRWRIVDTLGYKENWWDPYNRNFWKGDKPLYDDWFFSTTITSDTIVEKRDVPTPIGASSTQNPGGLDIFGNSQQDVFAETLAMEFVYYKGDTTFRPPDYEFRFIPVFNYNRVELEEVQGVNADPNDGTTRYDNHVGIQGAFFDYHIRNLSDQYDFDSVRIGIQPFTADFRGFLFQDSPFGIRLFGTRDNNIFQYNLAWFRRLEKDTNSGLNDTSKSMREDDIFVANLYWQDTPVLGFTSQFTLLHNRNNEDEPAYDNNDFIVRPASLGREVGRKYQATYFGYNGDGHFGRLNVSTSNYMVVGEEDGSVFRKEKTAIEAYFTATELSMDFDWIRVRGAFIHASGDSDP